MNICYWCGKEATGREHVPPIGFFHKQFRDALITVPSCREHNEEFSKLDERNRFYIQAAADLFKSVRGFHEKTIRGLNREESTGLRKSIIQSSRDALLDGKESLAFDVDPDVFNTFVEKIIRGLHYWSYDTVFFGDIFSACTHISPPGFDIRPIIYQFSNFRKFLVNGNTTYPEIFRYEIGKAVDSEAFGAIITFYDVVTIFGFGIPLKEGAE